MREQSCPLHDEFSGAVVREQSSVRRGGDSSGRVAGEQSSVPRVGVVDWRPVPKPSDEDVFSATSNVVAARV